jgi:protein-S-isoprenylcysteine O-methyltransferase Ste14
MTARPKSAASGVKFPPPAIFVLSLAAGFLIRWRWPASIWPAHDGALRAAGAAFFSAGLLLALWAVGVFRAAGTSPNPTRPTAALALSGPYRFTRNPMYLGLSTASAGIAMFWNALWPLLCVPVAMALVSRFVIAREERYLASRFGAPYLEYARQVRRWI